MSRIRMIWQYGLFAYIMLSAMYGVWSIFNLLGKALANRSKK